jgi:PadR family transcriptional regulator PadR
VTQLRKGLMELCVLRLLRRGESYGYEIVRQLQALPALAVSESTIYPVLARLRAEGCIQARDAPSPAGPSRRYFSLTARGRMRLAEYNAHWNAVIADLDSLHRPSRKESSP